MLVFSLDTIESAGILGLVSMSVTQENLKMARKKQATEDTQDTTPATVPTTTRTAAEEEDTSTEDTTRTAAEEDTSGEVPRGMKRCPHCGKLVSGYRTKVCPHCGSDFPIRDKGERTTSTSTNHRQADPTLSLEAALKMLGRAREIAEEDGGSVADFLARVEEVLSSAEEFGSVENLRKCLELLVQMGGR